MENTEYGAKGMVGRKGGYERGEGGKGEGGS